MQQRPPMQQRKPASPLLQQRSFAALMLAIISLLGMSGVSDNLKRGVVVLVVTMVIGGVGLWLSFTAMSRSRKEGTGRPRFAVAATVLGIIGTGLSALALIGFATFWPQISQYANCMSGANTVATQNACAQQLNSSLQTSMQILNHR
jgi:ABC-type amino acid transport system permease subunit